jgi:FkbM family methyltransferase
MREHLSDNGVDLAKATLVEAAVAREDGEVWFHVGDAADWYGQRIEDSPPAADVERSSTKRGWLGRNREREDGPRGLTKVDAVSLRTLLAGEDPVDLIDSDVQGAEADVFEGAADRLSEVVRRVHIGTHSDENEERLRSLFSGLGWECLNDYSNGRENATPYGTLHFEDGVQTWLNPRLAS